MNCLKSSDTGFHKILCLNSTLPSAQASQDVLTGVCFLANIIQGVGIMLNSRLSKVIRTENYLVCLAGNHLTCC